MKKYFNKVTLTVAIIILFVPTIIAFIYLNQNDAYSPNIPDDADVSVSFSNGNIVSDADDELTELIIKDINDADAILNTSGLPLFECRNYLMTVRIIYSATKEQKKEYTCYISYDSDKCYFKNENGTVYPFTPSTAALIMKLDACQEVFPYSAPPAASYTDSEKSKELSASYIEWQYLNSKKETVTIKPTDNPDSVTSITIHPDDDFASAFDFGTVNNANGVTDHPAKVSVAATIGETSHEPVLLSEFGTFIESLKIDIDTNIDITVSVEWGDEQLANGYFGKCEYKISIFYDIPVSYELSATSFKAGTTTVMYAKNLNEGETVTASLLSPDGTVSEYQPKFVYYNGKCIAFLPFDFNVDTGLYTVKFTSSSGQSDERKVNIKSSLYSTRTFSVPPIRISENYGDSKKLSFNMTMEDVFAETKDQKLWEGKFSYPMKIRLSKQLSYGQKVIMNGEYEDRSYCSVYLASAGTQVFAANNGVVVYAGETAITGKTVVIEHGFGLKTWYWNLSETDVEVGAEIAKGDKLGIVGTTGLCTEKTPQLSYAVSIGNVFITPDLFFDRTISYFG